MPLHHAERNFKLAIECCFRPNPEPGDAAGRRGKVCLVRSRRARGGVTPLRPLAMWLLNTRRTGSITSRTPTGSSSRRRRLPARARWIAPRAGVLEGGGSSIHRGTANGRGRETTVVVVERAESWSDGPLHTPHIQTSQRVREHTSDMFLTTRVVAMSDHGISTQRLDDYLWVVALSGEHDLSDVAEVERAIASVFDEGSVPVIDLTQATLVDSTVMDAILYAHELAATSRDRDMAVIATPETHTRRSLELGLCGYINVYDTLPAALEALTLRPPAG